jgi:hypothetical protein
MKIKKVSLLTLLISFFVFYSCKKATTIGLDLDANAALNSQIAYDSTVLTQLVREDSIITNFQTLNPLGFFNDPVFGTTEANIAAALTLPGGATTKFDASAVLDSAVLVLPFAGFYGDSVNTKYTIDVQELNESLYEIGGTPFYYNTKQWKYNPSIVGSDTLTAAGIQTSPVIADILVGKKDTLKKVIPQLRITLNHTYITNLLLKADSATLSSNSRFTNYFKGLYISLNKAASTNNGGIFLFNTATANAARVDVFYKETKANKTDTLLKSFALAGNQGLVASHIKWNYNNTTIANQIGKPITEQYEQLYMKGFSGTKVKLSFPNIKNLQLLGTKILVNRAQLIIKVIKNTETPYAPLPVLKMYKLDIANRPQLLPDENPNDPRNIGAGYISGLFNNNTNEYVLNVTGYVQDLLNNKPDYGAYITTINYAADQQRNNAATIKRTIIGGGLGNYKMKLKVYYTDQK